MIFLFYFAYVTEKKVWESSAKITNFLHFYPLS